MPEYQRLTLSETFYCEGGAFADLNRDGHPDVISGPYWYAGPDFQTRHELYSPQPFDPLRYSDNFVAEAYDVDGDGWLDVMVIGFPGTEAVWYENPAGTDRPWRRHLALDGVDNESAMFGDVNGDGRPDLICSHQGRWGYAEWNPQAPTGPWTFRSVSKPGPWQRFTHGLGFGDVNGDGRMDLIERGGWWEQPADPEQAEWRLHPADFGKGGAQMYALDLNGDGLPDIVTSRDAHGYGLSWFEQVRATDGATQFREHVILPADETLGPDGVQFSQLHAVTLADLDGDGHLDLVTGKRWWAHGPKGDPEPNADPVVYAFLYRRDDDGSVRFEPRLIDRASGVGTALAVADANGDGGLDILAANKRGTFLFLSQHAASRP